MSGYGDKHSPAKASFEKRLRSLISLRERYPGASDIFVNGDAIYLATGEKKMPLSFSDFDGLEPQHVYDAAKNAAMYAGVEFGPRSPILSVKMHPDLRVTCVIPPAADKLYLDVRFLSSKRIPLESYADERDGRRIMAADDVECIKGLVTGKGGFEHRITTDGTVSEGSRARKPNIIISGATGAGKTTLMLAALGVSMSEDPHERIILIEDTPEVRLDSDAVVSLVTAENADMDALLKAAMRLTGDRLVVGEVRDHAALTLVMLAGTGHDGTICTLHSFGRDDAITRLHNMARLGNQRITRGEVAAVFDYVIQMEGKGSERNLESIYKVPKNGMEERSMP